MEFCCRLCLKETLDTESIFNVREDLPISVIIMIMCPIKIHNNDKLSKNICFECLEIVIAAFVLRENSINNDRYQRSFLKNVPVDKMIVEQEVRVKEENFEEENYNNYFSDPIAVESVPISIKASTSKKSTRISQYKVNCYKKNAKSIAWSYFGLLTDESVIVEDQKEYYFCRICVEEQNVLTKYKRSVSTSGMLIHLTKDHAISSNEEIKQLGAEQNTCDFCHQCFENNIALLLHIKYDHLNLSSISTQIERIDNTVNYKVEENTNRNRKSMIWDYFGLLMTENGEIVESEINYNYCRICVEERKNLTTKYKKTVATSNMLHHLKIEHGIEMSTNDDKSKRSIETSSEISKSVILKSTETSKNELQFKVKLHKKHSKSFAWKYFGLLIDANNDIIEEHVDYHFCQICVEKRNVLTLKYKKTAATSVMLQHLKTEHSFEAMNCDDGSEKDAMLIAENSSHRIRVLKEPFKQPNQHLSCDICGKTCDRKQKIRMHMRLKHVNELLPAIFTCDICGNSFTKNYILTKHMKIHSGIKFPCDRCPAQLCNLSNYL